MPREDRMSKRRYKRLLHERQVLLVRLQKDVIANDRRVLVVVEGRDAAGKDGLLKTVTEHMSPRETRVVALPKPTDAERSQWYFQRFARRFPSRDEIVLFNRSWYNRAGVEYVMGFCTPKQHRRFLELCPQIERFIVESGIILIKFWLEVGQEEQDKRFRARIDDPLRQWKLSPMDVESYHRWYAYSRARDVMLKETDSDHAPWFVVRSDDKRRARLNCIAHVLRSIPFKRVQRKKIKLSRRSQKGQYDDQATLRGRRFVKEAFF